MILKSYCTGLISFELTNTPILIIIMHMTVNLKEKMRSSAIIAKEAKEFKKNTQNMCKKLVYFLCSCYN